MGVRLSTFQNAKKLQTIDHIFESNNINEENNEFGNFEDEDEEEAGDFTYLEGTKKHKHPEKSEKGKDIQTSPNKAQISIKQMFENISKQKAEPPNDVTPDRIFCPVGEKRLKE
eukprot:TRINITY_DN4975_c0_g1_i1.p2 TRINITY_DN4975_c0_g1~~TRINITY_DN4975_c0_g1_i1.p2  ORF type:complete len:114 (-),score=31.37 TRINITY_DN4975_c0_g1_i1:151-492(-)